MLKLIDIFWPDSVLMVTSGEATTLAAGSGRTPPCAIDPIRTCCPLVAGSGPCTAIAPLLEVAVMYTIGLPEVDGVVDD